jgi:hypothetical protein
MPSVGTTTGPPGQRPSRCAGAPARAALRWSALFFAGWQVILTVWLECCLTGPQDGEHSTRLACLHARLEETPDRSLMLMVGSSRTMNGIQAERLGQSLRWRGRPVTAFNFGIPWAGPIRQLYYLRQLLAEGVRPDVLLVEVWPPLLNEPGPNRLSEEGGFNVASLRGIDVVSFQPYHSSPVELWRRWFSSRLLPCWVLRQSVRTQLGNGQLPLPAYAVPMIEGDRFGWRPIDGSRIPAEERERRTERACKDYSRGFRDFRIGPGSRRALTELLELCRRERIRVVLMLLPEGTVFRDLDPGDVWAEVRDWLAKLRQEHGADLIDAREWVADEHFLDAHHLLPEGATIFSARLVGELRRLPGLEPDPVWPISSPE